MNIEEQTVLVSTIITTYKRSDTLQRAIESVLNQTYKNIEIIIVDDNNDDEHRQKVVQLMEKYKSNPTIKYIKHPRNMNGANARNTGLKNISGDYITFLDDDDYYKKDRFEVLVPLLKESQSKYGLICSAFTYLKNDKVYRENTVSIPEKLTTELLKTSFNIGSGSNFILKKEVITEIGGFDPRFTRHQDLEFLVRVSEKYEFLSMNSSLLFIELDSPQQNKINIDRLIATKKMYLEKYQGLINEQNRSEVINSNMESLIYTIFLTHTYKEHLCIIKKYLKQNKIRGLIKVLFFLIRAKLKYIIT